MSALAKDLRWLVTAIAAPRTPSPSRLRATAISAADGLAIYRDAYRLRLRECLADDFPAVRALLGSDAFDELADAVIAWRPPCDPTLNRYGRRLVQWLRLHRDRHHPATLDLARLEWALVEAIHAPLAPALAPERIAAVPPRSTSRIRLVPMPSLRLVASRWAVDALYRQHQRDERPDPGEPLSCTVAVVRDHEGLHRHPFLGASGRLVADLARGRPMAAALARTRLPADAVQTTLARAMAAGLFTDLTTKHP